MKGGHSVGSFAAVVVGLLGALTFGVVGPVGSLAPAPVEESASFVAGCWWDPSGRSTPDAEHHRNVVGLAYCTLLGRAADAEGVAYWSEQLAAGLQPADLAVQLAGSPEFLNQRFDRTPGIDSPLDALALLAPTGVEPGSVAAAAVDDSVRANRTIAADEFEAWVAGRAGADDFAGTVTIDEVSGALTHVRIVGGGQRINVAYVHRSTTEAVRVSPADRGRSTVGTWAAEIGADVAVNGNWYSPWDGPAVSNGQVYGGADHAYTALLGFTARGEVLIEHHREVNEGVDPRVVEGVSGHPTLVYRGTRTIDFGTDPTFLNRHPRTAIGLDASGDVLILVTVDGRQVNAGGMTGDETARLLEQLGAHDALMLDGGGSTTMWIAGRGVVNQPSGSLRAVGNQLAAFAR